MDFLRKLLAKPSVKTTLDTLEQVLPVALQVVQIVNQTYSHKTTDELDADCAAMATTDFTSLPATRNDMLRFVARALLEQKLGRSLKDTLANSAIELAVLLTKAHGS